MPTPRAAADDRGFTLVEILTVVMIIGILVMMAVASYAMSVANAKRIVCFDNQRVLENATSLYEADIDTTPTVMADLEPYINQYVSASKCPADGRELEFDPQTLAVTCTYPGHQH